MDETIYEPREDSYLLQKYVEQYCKKDFVVLDIGTGTGIQAITAAKKTKKVIACDINPIAVKCAKESAEIEKIKNIKFIESDLFSHIPKIKFDLIVFNPPYLPEEKNVENIALFSAKRGTETTVRFLNDANRFLKKEGIILLIGSSLASWSILEETIKKNLFDYEILEKQHVFFEDIFVLLLKKSELLIRLNKKGISNARLFARGKRGIIIKADYKKKSVAVKIKKLESQARGTIENEISFLKILNKYDIGPRLITYEKDFLMYKFVEGDFIFNFVKANSKKEILIVLKKIFSQLYKMDKRGINKFEMHHPLKHIIIDKNRPVLIDFERARNTIDPKNVTQFCDFIIGDDMVRLLKEKKIIIKKEAMINRAKQYKHKLGLEKYKKIIALLK